MNCLMFIILKKRANTTGGSLPDERYRAAMKEKVLSPGIRAFEESGSIGKDAI